jgi:hypothetical protein
LSCEILFLRCFLLSTSGCLELATKLGNWDPRLISPNLWRFFGSPRVRLMRTSLGLADRPAPFAIPGRAHLPDRLPLPTMAEGPDAAGPISEPTRKERQFLLGTSIVLLAIVLGGVQPTEISALGIKFTPANILALRVLLFAVHTFVLVAFLIAARAERRLWYLRVAEASRTREARIDSCFSHLTWGNHHKVRELTVAIDELKAILHDLSDYIRPEVMRDLQWNLNTAEIACNFERAAQEQDRGVQRAFATLHSLNHSAAGTPETPMEAAIHLAMHQHAIYELLEPLRNSVTWSARKVTRRHRQRLKQLSFDLCYMTHDVPELKKYLAEAVGYLNEAKLGPPKFHLLPDEIRARLDTLETYIKTFEEFSDDISEIKGNAMLVLMQNYQGFSEAGSRLMSDVDGLRNEFTRSNRSFELQAFWEFTVPLIVGFGSLAISGFVLALPRLLQ